MIFRQRHRSVCCTRPRDSRRSSAACPFSVLDSSPYAYQKAVSLVAASWSGSPRQAKASPAVAAVFSSSAYLKGERRSAEALNTDRCSLDKRLGGFGAPILEKGMILDLGSSRLFGLRSLPVDRRAGVYGLVGVRRPEDPPAPAPGAEQVGAPLADPLDAIDPCQEAGGLQRADGLGDGRAGAARGLGDSLVAREAAAAPGVVEGP